MKLAKATACLALLPLCILGGLLIGLIVGVVYTVSLGNQLWRAFR
jgi:hypothetical protein